MHIHKSIAAAAVIALTAGAALADPVEGIWQTQVDDGAYALVTIAPCGPAFCGVISRTFNDGGEYDSENKGKPLVWDMMAAGGGDYRDGKIWQPSTGKVYRSKMALEGDLLKVSGCIGPICKKQTWARVK
ncbi:DUF2147 domain-containing protein [Pseudooceanicola sediminis]|uniref:DUF2147 domain-containing protein n=1 Tax=Pseudooceanicola sediminis TaxID=2211117 RepID=A0A399J2E1_9RHOB|nr:DUF2147 domain-containing protein [Pseudooceanicola sediminis]KAA2312053.1 DUF2147 domain-containing protein [Puniceibacterium sp. HSS470]RII38062.1 DUF2147 domain-containing protein [Pseudooceanicola sediminis]|tara:strand:+ start:29465 stop:29854 length:390 start_codon:yes stop_codon:yes gene_type:complete